MSLRFPLRTAQALMILLLASAPAFASLTPNFGLSAVVTYSGEQIVFDATDAGGHGAGTTVTFTLRQPDGTVGRFSTETDEAGRFVIALDARGLADHDTIQVSIRRNGVFTFTLLAIRQGSGSASNAKPEPWTPAIRPNKNVQAAVCASETCSAGPCDPFSADLFTRSNEPMNSGVNLADGTVITHHSVLSFPTRRLGFDLRLHHQSMTGYAGPVGNGWSHSFNMFIVQTEATKGSVVTPDLRVFSIVGGGPTQVPGEWEPPEGFFSRLRQDRARNRWVLTHHTGAVFQFLLAPEGLPGPLIQIDDTNGNSTRARLESSGFLTRVETDLGQTVRFDYGAGGRLASVTDPLGRTWRFSHDPLGNLTAVTSPQTETADVPAGREITDADLPAVLGVRARTTRFVYEDSRFLDFITRIVDPRGAETRAYTYHHGADATARDPDEGRVEALRINGGTVSLLYRVPTGARPVPKATLEAGNSIVRVTDREGNVTDHEIQGRSNGPVNGEGAFGLRRLLQWTEKGKGNRPLRPGGGTTTGGGSPGEPDAWETRWLHDCDCLSPIEASQPFRSDAPPHFDGNGMPDDAPIELFTYNDRRQVTGYEFQGGAGESIRWTKTYQTFERFSRLLTYTEPRGFDASPVYAGLGFTHVYSYDPAGNLLTHAAPTVTRGVPGGSQPIVEAWTYNPFGQPLSHRDPNGNFMTYTYFEGPGRARGVNARDGFAGYMASMTRGAPGSAGPALDLTTRFRVNALGWVTERIDPAGFSYLTEYDTLGEVTREVEPEVPLENGTRARYETRFVYDSAGNQVMERRSNVDFDGTVPTNAFIDRSRSFDAVGNLLSERMEVDADDAHDLITRYAYDPNDQRSVLQKPEGNRMFYVFDERRLLFKTFYGIAPGGAVAESYPADKTAATLAGVSFVGVEALLYDAPGNVIERRDGRGNITRSFFDFANRLVATRDPNGHGRTMMRDNSSNILTESRGDILEDGTLAGPPLARTYFRYDEENRTYETVRDLDPVTDESGAIDPDDGRSSAERTFFDAGGRSIRRLDAEGHSSLTFYDAADRVVSTEDALGNARYLFYDTNSNIIQENDLQRTGPGASGASELYVFCHAYDELKRRIHTRNHGLNGTAIDHHTFFDWDSRGNLRRLRDAEGNITLMTLDDADRRIRLQRFAGTDGAELSRWERVFDRNWNIVDNLVFRDVADSGSAQVTHYDYDQFDRRERTVHPDGGVVETRYDATSNPILLTDQRGVQLKNVYDRGNRLTDQEITLPAGIPGEQRRNFDYDSLDRLVLADNDYSHVGREYDPLSRLSLETQAIRLTGRGAYEEPIQLRYEYDRQGNRASLSVVDNSGRNDLEVRSVYDDLNRIQTIQARTFSDDVLRPVADYMYFGSFRVQRKTLGNGAFLAASYDRKPQLARHVWQAPGGTLLVGFEYAYDNMYNALSERFLHDKELYDNFDYDSRYELTGASFRQPNPVDYRTFEGSFRDRFEYDGVFNRTAATFGEPRDSEPAVKDIYRANPVNEYQEISRNGQPFDPEFDPAGNAVTLPVRPTIGVDAGRDVMAKARYDAFNRLFEIKAGTGPTQHFFYDVLGRRIAILEFEGSGSGGRILRGSRRFLYDGWTDVEERLFLPGVSISGASSLLERVYVHGPRIDELLLTSVDGDGDRKILGTLAQPPNTPGGPDFEYFTLDNRMGSVMALLDRGDPGRILESYRYGAYGVPVVLSTVAPVGLEFFSTVNHFFFTGRWLEGKTGLYDFRKRFMDPMTGRFLQRDPIGAWQDPMNLGNAYAYVGNNPLNNFDPWGDFGLGDIATIGGAVAGGVVGFVAGGPAGAVAGAIIGGAIAGGIVGGISEGPSGILPGAIHGAIVGGFVGAGAVIGASVGGVGGGIAGALIGAGIASGFIFDITSDIYSCATEKVGPQDFVVRPGEWTTVFCLTTTLSSERIVWFRGPAGAKVRVSRGVGDIRIAQQERELKDDLTCLLVSSTVNLTARAQILLPKDRFSAGQRVDFNVDAITPGGPGNPCL